MTKESRVLLLIPALWSSLFDITLTIAHQPEEYWNGDLTKGNEANPIGALFMANHIAGLFIISGIWFLAIGLLGYLLPWRIGKVFLFFCFVVHTVGASTWLSRFHGFWYVIIMVMFNSILYCFIDDKVKREPVSR